MNVDDIAKALGARQEGDGWSARCPAHDDKNPSLSIRIGYDGKVLVYCHAGCDQRRVIDALSARGLWEQGDQFPRRAIQPQQRHSLGNLRGVDDARRKDAATKIWRAAVPAAGTLVDTYLLSRGITKMHSEAIRFHPMLRHPSGDTWPAMVALVTRGSDGVPLGVHRTFLSRDGQGKAPVESPKMMLGPCRGGAVRLSSWGGALMIGEGIETCLSVRQETRRQVWAALSTSGMRGLDLPEANSDVIVLADGDDSGEAAAQDAAQHWLSEGRRVRIARPPRGQDFNDLLPGNSSALPEIGA